MCPVVRLTRTSATQPTSAKGRPALGIAQADGSASFAGWGRVRRVARRRGRRSDCARRRQERLGVPPSRDVPRQGVITGQRAGPQGPWGHSRCLFRRRASPRASNRSLPTADRVRRRARGRSGSVLRSGPSGLHRPPPTRCDAQVMRTPSGRSVPPSPAREQEGHQADAEGQYHRADDHEDGSERARAGAASPPHEQPDAE
jgi:hypothetical protein